MNYEDTIKKIQTFEKCNDLKSFSINDVDMWPLLRFQLATYSFDRQDEKIITQKSLWVRALYKFKLFLKKDFIKLILKIFTKTERDHSFSNKKLLFLSDESSKRISLQGKWVDIFIDPFIHMNNFKEENFYILRSNQIGQTKKNSYSKELDINSIVMRSFVSAFFKMLYYKPSGSFIKTYEEIKKFNISILKNEKIPNMRDLIFEGIFIDNLSKKFGLILDKVKPSNVILTHYNGYISSAMTHASHIRGIQVSDIQHGVQGKLHPAYNFRNYPKKGFTTVPNNFFVWSKSDEENIRAWSSKINLNIKVIGNTNKYLFDTHDEVKKYYKNFFEEAFNDQLKKNLILVTLCWSYFIPDVILKIIKHSSDNNFFLIRFHPMTSDTEKKLVINKLDKINRKNYETYYSTKLPLHLMLSKVLMHIGIVSTVIEEGLEYNLPTIAIGSRAKAYWKDTNTNKLKFSNSYTEIKPIMENAIKRGYFD